MVVDFFERNLEYYEMLHSKDDIYDILEYCLVSLGIITEDYKKL